MAIIDMVRWAPQGDTTIYAYRFPVTNLSTYTQLVVQESQEAVLFSKGQIIGKFGAGKHTLDTENLPILRTMYGIPFGGKNPFTAEIWFINKIQLYNLDWSIDKMDIHDTDYNTGIPLTAFGRYGLKITDPERFLIKVVGTKNEFDQNDLTEQFIGEFSTKTKSTLMQFMLKNNIGIKQISAHLDNISDHLKSIMSQFWLEIGFELTKFYVTSIEVDGNTQAGLKIIEAISRQSAQAISGHTWQQAQAFEVAKDAVSGMANGNGGLLGAIVASNMMGGLGGGSIMQPQYSQPTFGSNTQQSINAQTTAPSRDVFCSNCAKKFSSNLSFCPFCGNQYKPCPKCRTDNNKDAKRCVSCGLQLNQGANICYNCNTPLAPASVFCGNCGKPQSDGAKCTRCSSTISADIKFCPVCGQKR